MCSVQDPEGILLKEEATSLSGRVCMKCGSAAVAVARTKDPFCKECFHGYVVHRFRATFGKSRLVTTGERVLLAFSGGQSSRVMLALSVEGLSHQVHKKLRFVPTVIFIDEGTVLGLSLEDRCRMLAEVLSIAIHSGFPVVFTQLEQVYGSYRSYSVDQLGPPTKVDLDSTNTGDVAAAATDVKGTSSTDLIKKVKELVTKQRDPSLESKLREVFDNTPTHTAKQNLLLTLRHRLLSEVARRSAYHKVLLGVNATQLAVRLLSNVAQGRGATLPLDVGFSDDRTHDVMFLRPLREFPSTEVATYVALHNLDTVSIPSLNDQVTDKSSIDHLTTTFITGLQADFPSTVNTVFRTGDKLTVGSQRASAEQTQCSLCQAPLTHEVDSSVFSHLNPPNEASKTVWSTLCYGCRLTARDMSNGVSSLPPFVFESSTKAHDSARPSGAPQSSTRDYTTEGTSQRLFTGLVTRISDDVKR